MLKIQIEQESGGARHDTGISGIITFMSKQK
jgi:hypothetical protein